jgi:hypothetical protein
VRVNIWSATPVENLEGSERPRCYQIYGESSRCGDIFSPSPFKGEGRGEG